MSSDKAPEKLYYDYNKHEITKVKPLLFYEYIREDSVPIKIEPLDVEEQQRRREMFEKVALANIYHGNGYTWREIAIEAEAVISESDKFAKGEK